MPRQPLHNCVGLSECQLSLPPHSIYYYMQTQHREREVGISETVAAAAGALGPCKVLCWLPVIASRNTTFLSVLCSLPTRWPERPMSTIHPHWCHIASTVAYFGSLAYCATLGDTFDLDQLLMTSPSSIIFKWPRQALWYNQPLAFFFSLMQRHPESWHMETHTTHTHVPGLMASDQVIRC